MRARIDGRRPGFGDDRQRFRILAIADHLEAHRVDQAIIGAHLRRAEAIGQNRDPVIDILIRAAAVGPHGIEAHQRAVAGERELTAVLAIESL